MSLGVVHLDSDTGWRGGQRQVLELVLGLERRGHRCLLACDPRGELAHRAGELTLARLDYRSGGDLDLRGLPRLWRQARLEQPDLIHSHTARNQVAGSLLARSLGIPHVHSRRVDFAPRQGLLSRLKYRRGIDRYLAVSAEVARVLAAAGIDPGRVLVVHSGIDPARLEAARTARAAGTARAALGLPESAEIVGAVGHLAAHKGHRILIEAAAAVLRQRPAALFLLAGKGAERPVLEEACRRLGLGDRFRLLGFQDDVPALLAAIDVLAMPSLTEGLGTVILDAMAMELPVAGSRTGGIPEAVEDGVTGLLVPPGDSGALAAALVRLLTDREQARRLGRAGRLRMEAEFHIERTIERTEVAYRDLMAERGRPV